MRELAWVVCVTFLCAGCSAGAEPSHDQPVDEGPAEEISAEEAALAAYEGMLQALVEGSHQGASDHPYLERYATGQALDLARDMLDGTTFTGEPISSPEVVGINLESSPPTAEIEDCLSDAYWVVEGVLPSESDDSESYRIQEVTVILEQDAWRVEQLWLGEDGSCQPPQ